MMSHIIKYIYENSNKFQSHLSWKPWKKFDAVMVMWCQGYRLETVGMFICFFHQHDDVIKWKHFSRHWPFVRGIHRLPVNSPHKGRWCAALMFSLICAWINGWVNNCEAGDLRRHRAHYDVTVMELAHFRCPSCYKGLDKILRWIQVSVTHFVLHLRHFFILTQILIIMWHDYGQGNIFYK